MSTSTIIPAATVTREVSEIIREYNAMKASKRGEWYLLEPGDPFYEDHKPFDSINDEGPAYTNFVTYYSPDGEEISVTWADVKPRNLSAARLTHFRNTPNELLIGRDGTLIVSAGTWGRREKPQGGYEYVPKDEFWEWRTEQMITEPRTVENRPSWAEDVRPIALWRRVDFSVTRGAFTFEQRLERDDSMSPPSGHFVGGFFSADDLRAIAREALELADILA